MPRWTLGSKLCTPRLASDERAGHHRRLHWMEFIRWDRGSWSLGIDVKKLDLISAPILIE